MLRLARWIRQRWLCRHRTVRYIGARLATSGGGASIVRCDACGAWLSVPHGQRWMRFGQRHTVRY